MPDAISHQWEVLTELAADLAEDLPGGLNVALGLVLDGTVHYVTEPPADAAWPMILAAVRTKSLVKDDKTIVVPLIAEGVLSGVLVAPMTAQQAPLAFLRLLASHLASEAESSRLHNRLETMLRDYVSAGFADTLMGDDNAGELGGAQREVTVLFADLRGFTSFTERTAWEVVVSHLNQVFGPAISIIEDHGGTVANLMGDGIMATFGAVGVRRDHAILGAKAALALTQAFADANPDLPRFGVGVSTGPAVVGNIGGHRRRVFTAIGDTVNLAARLEGIAKPGQVIIASGTRRAIGPLAQVQALEPVRLKGKEVLVQAYWLKALPDRQVSRDTIVK